MATDHTYTTNLAEFVDKAIKRWAADKKKILEPKLTRNFEAVTNADFRTRTWKKGEAQDWRSDTWIGFVRVKVWALFSVLLDTILKAGKIPFVLTPSPYDEKYMTPEMLKDRDARIERMTSKIEAQLDARNADREYMKKWLSGGYYGMAFSKFNIEDVENIEYKMTMPNGIDVKSASQFMSPEEIQQYARYEMVKDVEATPGHPYVSVWNMVWDMDSENLQLGCGYAERIKSSAYDLRKLIGKPGYIEDAIEKVIRLNRDKKNQSSNQSDSNEAPGKAALTDRKKTIDRYEFYMRAPRQMVDEFEKLVRSGDSLSLSMAFDIENAEETGDDVETMGEIAEHEIIRMIRNETGMRPHKMWVVEQNLDESTGTGIADNMESVQSSLVGMIRSFEDNKKLSANVITALKARFFKNPSQTNEIKPGTKLEISDSCDDVRKAILPIVFPDVGESLMSGISLMMQLKDDVSMIPTIMQGFTLPKHQPDTAFEMNELTKNSGKYVGQAIRNNDEQFIEPEINDMYRYNMEFGDDEECKVNCKIKANGFTSFQNKEIRGARMQQALSLFVTNEFLLQRIKIQPHLEVIYESLDEDPAKFIKSEEELMTESQNRMEQEAKAKQEAIQALQVQSQIETQKETAIKDKELATSVIENAQQSKLNMAEEDQKHEHRLIEKMAGDLSGAMYKNESQGGSNK
jgi:hypothetical protein